MADMYDYLKHLYDVQLKNLHVNEGDYEKDGLWICGKCGEYKTDIAFYEGREPLKHIRYCACMRAEADAEKARERVKASEIEANRKRSLSGMNNNQKTARFRNYMVTSFNSANVDFCKNYARKFAEMKKNNCGLLLWGDVGTGKSQMAACIANDVIDQGYSVYMTSAVNLMDDDERILNSTLLIIDDFGAERKTDYAAERVFKVIDERYGIGKPLIITTNLSRDEMESSEDIRYARMYDRIFEMCYPLHFEGKSWRKMAAATMERKIIDVMGK